MTAPDPLVLGGDALACLELASIARGIAVLDQMIKRAEHTVVAARTISSGRYFLLLDGRVAEIEEAMQIALETASDSRVDDAIIRDAHADLRTGLASQLAFRMEESLLIGETATLCSGLIAIDRALKETDVKLVELRLGAGLSGKCAFTLTGALHMAQAAEQTIRSTAANSRLLELELIARPHPDLPNHLLGAEPAGARGASPSSLGSRTKRDT